ncbi:MAG TPA: helix-turn-helix transcriptional regulator [bacterium]|nr:helix-turn-helix transcriptional regulator [bacterium]
MSASAIGEQLQKAREARGLSIEYVASETNIAKRYIAAMEAEDFSVFPGDPYIVGFLRNYAEYLGIDSTSIVQSFRGLRIQEQPMPIQELLQPKRLPLKPIIAAAVVIVVALGAFLVVRLLKPGTASAPQALTRSAPAQLTMDSATFEKRLYEGDTVLVPFNGDSYRLTISRIDDRVAIQTPVGVSRFMLGEEGSIDLNKDNKPELVAFIVDFQKNDASKGAVVRLQASGSLAAALGMPQPSASVDANTSGEPAVTSAAVASAAAAGAIAPNAVVPNAATDRASTQDSIVFSGKRSPYPFVVNVTFRNYAMFRHEIDRHDREEHYYHKGDQISVTANNSAKLWMSNAAACKLTIQASGGQSADIEMGAPGEVAVKQIRWTQGDDGTWSLGVYNVN